MFEKYKTGFYIGGVYLAGIMGAGFATGQELLRYFVRFGIWGLWGIILCGFLFALVGFKVLYFMHIKGISDYREFLACLMGKKWAKAAEAVSFCFIIALYSSMLAATGSLAENWLGISRFWGICAMLMVCSALVIGGVKSLGTFSVLLCPLLIGGSIFLGLRLYFGDIQVFAPLHRPDDNILGSVLIYVSYNIISGVSLLCALSSQIRNIRDAVLGGALGGLAIGVVGFVLALPLHRFYEVISGAELPIFMLIKESGAILRGGYGILLLSAVLTTAASCCYSAVSLLKTDRMIERVMAVALVGGAAFLLSLMGFSHIVGRLYYVFGVIGLAELAVIVAIKV